MARYTVTPNQMGGYTVRKYGCLSTLVTWLIVLALVGLSIQYWYVTVPVLGALLVGLILYARHNKANRQIKS